MTKPRTYGPGYRPVPEDPARCVESVFDNFGNHQCRNKRGKGPDGLHCGVHDPEAVAAKAAKQSKRWAEKIAQRPETILRNKVDALKAVLQEIVDRHIPSQPAANDTTRLEWVESQYTQIRIIARKALETI